MNSQPACIILGGGGHARVLIDCLQLCGMARLVGVLDADQSRWGQSLLNVPILGGDERLAELAAQDVNCFAVGVGGTGDNRQRRKLFEFALSCGLRSLTIQHPTATLSPHSTIGDGAQLLPGCIVNAGAILGFNVIVNSGAIVEHDCVIGDHAHIATGARLASTVHVGAGAHIGVGATIRQCITIGAGAIVGAGAVVVRDVPPNVIVVGIPAHRLRDVSH